MKKNNIVNSGIVLSLLVLFVGAAVIPNVVAQRSMPDPDQSSVTLVQNGYPGLNTCPRADHGSNDGTTYRYIRVTVRDVLGNPIPSVPAGSFDVIINPIPGDLVWYGTLSCTLNSAATQTDANGQIDFEMWGDTSIIGNATLTITVMGIPINDAEHFAFKSFDSDVNGGCTLADFSRFALYYNGYNWRNNFNWDPANLVSLADFSMFAIHYNHLHP